MLDVQQLQELVEALKRQRENLTIEANIRIGEITGRIAAYEDVLLRLTAPPEVISDNDEAPIKQEKV